MKRFSLSIAGMMALILIAAIGFAALRGGTVLWASVTFSVVVTMLSAAVLGACAARGPERITWIGFAFFGWVYLGAAFGPQSNGGTSIPPLLPMAAYELLLNAKWKSISSETGNSMLVNKESREEGLLKQTGLYSGDVVLFQADSMAPSVPGSYEIRNGVEANRFALMPRPAPVTVDALQLRRIVHALGALAFGLVGAAFGRGFAAWYDRERRPAGAQPAA